MIQHQIDLPVEKSKEGEFDLYMCVGGLSVLGLWNAYGEPTWASMGLSASEMSVESFERLYRGEEEVDRLDVEDRGLMVSSRLTL